jgi:hypothetical protein
MERLVGEAQAKERELAARDAAAAATAGELRRVYGEESKLRGAVDEQTAHLGRTHAEIERLNRLIRDMEATRAWRLHRWLERRRR